MNEMTPEGKRAITDRIEQENKNSLFLCSRCKENKLPEVVAFVEGICWRHLGGFSPVVYEGMRDICKGCAEEKGICQLCGTKKEKEKL